MEELKSCSKEIHDKQTAIESQIHDTFREIHQVLEERETKLIDQLGEITREKLKSLEIQRDQIEITLAQLSSCLHFMQASLESADGPQVLMMKANTQSQIKKLTTTFQPDILEPVCKADMIFSTPTDLSTECHNFGVVSSYTDLADSSKSYATLSQKDHIFVGEMSTVILQVLNFHGQPCQNSVKSLECELLSEIAGTRVTGAVERKGQSEYVISYQPIVSGRHQLHIRLDRQHIQGSPFRVVAKFPVEKLGGIDVPIMTIANLKRPWGVAVLQKGEVLVTEWGGHCVSVFNSTGRKFRSFGTWGSGEGQFNHPRGIAVDSKGDIFVVDARNRRVQKLSAKGQFLAVLGGKGSAFQQFEDPRDIAISARNGKMYVTDTYCVHILNSDLTFSSTFGAKGHGTSEFNNAWGITCDNIGKVYVSDGHNNRVQVFELPREGF